MQKPAPRLEWSSFCAAQRNKKAGTEDGNWRPKKPIFNIKLNYL